MPEIANTISQAPPEIEAGPSKQSASECWHFDALSDDGREALVITFNDNYALSPRFFREMKSEGKVAEKRFPAVTFTYWVKGKMLLRAVNEFQTTDVGTGESGDQYSIEKSSFRQTSAEYGSGFVVTIDLLTPRKCRLEAELEWLSIETTDLSDKTEDFREIVVPRSDVSGRITRIGRRGKTRSIFHFRGTGYQDRLKSAATFGRPVSPTISGRAHFVDSTSIFHSYGSNDSMETISRLITVRDGATTARTVKMETKNFRRDRYGLASPGRITFVSDDNLRLRVKPLEAVESGFFKKVMTSEITLMLGDGKPRKTTGLVEFASPDRLKNSVLRWLSDLRIGRNGRSPLF